MCRSWQSEHAHVESDGQIHAFDAYAAIPDFDMDTVEINGGHSAYGGRDCLAWASSMAGSETDEIHVAEQLRRPRRQPVFNANFANSALSKPK